MDDDERLDHLTGKIAQEERDEERYESLAEAAGWCFSNVTGTWHRLKERMGEINIWLEAQDAKAACEYDELPYVGGRKI